MVTEEKLVTLSEAIAHQILQIQIAERSVKDALSLGSELLARQYRHLKKQYIEQLNEMLEQAELQIFAADKSKTVDDKG